MKLTETDLEQLTEKGITEAKANGQINIFKAGIPFVRLHKAAVPGHGILKFSEAEAAELADHFDAAAKNLSVLKFVPASGAASRMFKALFNFVEAYDPGKEGLEAYVKRTGDTAMAQFIERMDRFPFYPLVMAKIEGKYGTEGEKAHLFVKTLLAPDGLNYGFYPKGLLPFHKDVQGLATPFKEHLREAALYARAKGAARLHFTISPQHERLFKEEERLSVPQVASATGAAFDISYSFQKPSTDTLAVTPDNQPFRNPDGSLLFRPGGHGALIENLDEQDADIIFVKNIDNVATQKDLDTVGRNKKMLGGLLLRLQSKMFHYAVILEGQLYAEALSETAAFVRDRLNAVLPEGFDALGKDEKRDILLDTLNRPIRVCGMVKNEGEPGGGPFFIEDTDGNISLQIIESAQIDKDDEGQLAILRNATHFNPVDLVCGTKDHRGEKYDLADFVDARQGFITEKTKDGKALKALELPGLWNGAMAFWNTVFVEVPLATFNPVKTVNDLLKPSHQE